MSDIKRTITDFVSFNVSNDYYDETKKEELVDLLKEILFEDDVTVRKFLEKLFVSAESAAKSFGLFTNQGDVEDSEEETEEDSEEETEEETEEDSEEETEEDSEEETEETSEVKQESVLRKYRSIAAKYLYE